MALQDTDLARILLVALPETTPVHEAASLQEDLKRAGIIPYAWIINQCLSMHADLSDPILQSRAVAEIPIIKKVENELASRTFGIPYLAEENLLPALLHFYAAAVMQ